MKRSRRALVIASAMAMLAGTSGCGPYKVDVNDVNVTGTVTHVVKFELEDIRRYFQAECEREVPADEVESCTNAKVAQFLSFILTNTSP